jgi:uncharacterized protein (DUF2147 family)
MEQMRMRSVLVLLAVLASVSGTVLADKERQNKEAVYGIWATSGTMIEVAATGESLSARIIALKHPHWREKDGVGRIGEPKTDLHNPDESQHNKRMVGLEMLQDYEFRKGKWRGKLYLPTNGSKWTSTARIKNGELQLRGYIGVSMFGKTQSFAPLASCNENIMLMIRLTGMKDTPCDDMF